MASSLLPTSSSMKEFNPIDICEHDDDAPMEHRSGIVQSRKVQEAMLNSPSGRRSRKSLAEHVGDILLYDHDPEELEYFKTLRKYSIQSDPSSSGRMKQSDFLQPVVASISKPKVISWLGEMLTGVIDVMDRQEELEEFILSNNRRCQSEGDRARKTSQSDFIWEAVEQQNAQHHLPIRITAPTSLPAAHSSLLDDDEEESQEQLQFMSMKRESNAVGSGNPQFSRMQNAIGLQSQEELINKMMLGLDRHSSRRPQDLPSSDTKQWPLPNSGRDPSQLAAGAKRGFLGLDGIFSRSSPNRLSAAVPTSNPQRVSSGKIRQGDLLETALVKKDGWATLLFGSMIFGGDDLDTKFQSDLTIMYKKDMEKFRKSENRQRRGSLDQTERTELSFQSSIPDFKEATSSVVIGML